MPQMKPLKISKETNDYFDECNEILYLKNLWNGLKRKNIAKRVMRGRLKLSLS